MVPIAKAVIPREKARILIERARIPIEGDIFLIERVVSLIERAIEKLSRLVSTRGVVSSISCRILSSSLRPPEPKEGGEGGGHRPLRRSTHSRRESRRPTPLAETNLDNFSITLSIGNMPLSIRHISLSVGILVLSLIILTFFLQALQPFL